MKYIIIFITIAILIGCFVTAYFFDIRTYTLSMMGGASLKDRYAIRLIDETDIKYISMFVSNETLDNVAQMISTNTYVTDPNKPVPNYTLLSDSTSTAGVSVSGTAGAANTSGSAGAANTSGLAGAANTSGSAGAVNTSGSAGAVNTSGSAGAVNTSGSAGSAGNNNPSAPIQSTAQIETGSNMPWDRDVTPCNVLKNTDQDLYADVQDARRVTLY
jgi:hypothetical protein